MFLRIFEWEMPNKSFIDLEKNIYSGVILSGIYSRISTKVDSLFKAGACTLCFLTILAYLYG